MQLLTVWHHDLRLEDGAPYPLRNRLEEGPEYGDINDQVLGLTKKQSRTGQAVHELGHAMVWLAGGLHVVNLGIDIGRGGRAMCLPTNRTQEQQMTRIIGIVAGERAQDRWLRETGLWTPSRAAMAELGAAHDRSLVFAADPRPRPGFGSGGADYSDLHDLADRALDGIWGSIQDALPVLVRRGSLSGDQLAKLSGLTNHRIQDPAWRAV
ncbi:hypothetical protein ACWGLG_16655 [Streptomyces antimycoticus]